MSFAVVLEGMTIAAFTILLVGGKQKREQGWGVLTILVALAALVQAIAMALMVSSASQLKERHTDVEDRRTFTKTTNVSSLDGI
jgi:formate hydrogenlyase subunit 3/multisubunit Na+/H+ antiporter MnhD subunit